MTAVPAHIFREYDIRGVVGHDLTPEIAGTIARAYAAYLGLQPRRPVIVGRDNRESSPGLRDAIVGALTGCGCDVVDIGVVITPTLYFARIAEGIDAAVMITASHNPPEYNGMKLARGFATLYGEEIQEVRRLAEQGASPAGQGQGRIESRDAVSGYRAMLAEKIILRGRPLKVAVDCGSGTASLVAPDVIEAWGCDVLRQHCESDPTFPYHHPDPVAEENVRDLVDLVRRERCDVGIGFDGDGDRIGVVDDEGRIIWGDTLMALYWREILPNHPGASAIVEVKCSQALVEEVTRLGGRPLFYRTGHSPIKAKMKEIGAVFTGEMSGHMFFADEYYGYDDAVYAAGRLLRILSQTQEPLSQLLATIPYYPITPEVRVEAADDIKFDVVRELTETFKQRYDVIDVDGARVLFPEGWGLIRASNTQPALVLRAEAKTPEALGRIKREIEHALARFDRVEQPRW